MNIVMLTKLSTFIFGIIIILNLFLQMINKPLNIDFYGYIFTPLDIGLLSPFLMLVSGALHIVSIVYSRGK